MQAVCMCLVGHQDEGLQWLFYLLDYLEGELGCGLTFLTCRNIVMLLLLHAFDPTG